jgi:hypothetical protein
MLRRVVMWGLIMLVISLLAASAAVLADTEGGFMTPDGQWRMVDGAERHWYAFNYDGDSGQITIRMNVEPTDAATFKLLTPAGLRTWMEDGEIECTGCGSANAYDPADLVWSGNFNERATYTIIVERTGVKAGPAYYALSVEGDGVWYEPSAEAAPPEEEGVVAAAEAVTETAAEPVAPMGGTGPADALRPTGAWMTLDVAQNIWFAFPYDGRNSKVDVYMDASPSSGANFSIWTPEQIRLWALGEDVSPVGRGAENEYTPGDLFWSGSFAAPSTYYVKVEHAGGGVSNIALHVAGEDVWW